MPKRPSDGRDPNEGRTPPPPRTDTATANFAHTTGPAAAAAAAASAGHHLMHRLPAQQVVPGAAAREVARRADAQEARQAQAHALAALAAAPLGFAAAYGGRIQYASAPPMPAAQQLHTVGSGGGGGGGGGGDDVWPPVSQGAVQLPPAPVQMATPATAERLAPQLGRGPTPVSPVERALAEAEANRRMTPEQRRAGLQALKARNAAREAEREAAERKAQALSPASIAKSVDELEDRVAKNAHTLNADYAARLRRLSDRAERTDADIACIKTQPVYLGGLYFPGGEISSSKMRLMLIADAATWTTSKFNFSPLKAFFQPRMRGGGYELKTENIDIDHVIPKSMGGLDHPRNYVVMSRSLNRSFGADVDEKFFTLGRTTTVAAKAFVQGHLKATAGQRAEYLRDLDAR
jgi:HNH endonuclease